MARQGKEWYQSKIKNGKGEYFSLAGPYGLALFHATKKEVIVIIRRLRKRIWLVRFSFWEMRT